MRLRSHDAAGAAGLRQPTAEPMPALRPRRILPSSPHGGIGPFVVLDQLGPAMPGHDELLDPPGNRLPGVEMLTFLFDGQIRHRDPLSGAATLRPGDVHRSGAGVVGGRFRSATPEGLAEGSMLFGMEAWIALPAGPGGAEAQPQLFGRSDIPRIDADGVAFTLIAGACDGLVSPVLPTGDLVYAEILLTSGACYVIRPQHRERAVYVVGGEVEFAGRAGRYGESSLILLEPGRECTVRAPAFHATRLMLLGGDPLPKAR